MHDLNTINHINAEAYADHVKAERERGKHVVVTFTGLHLARHEVFDTAAEAQRYVARQPFVAGDVLKVLPPL